MRVIVFVRATKNSEAGVMPSEDLLTAMSEYNEELTKADILQSGEGLKPSSRGKRISISSRVQTVNGGPFEPISELVSGFWIWKVNSMDEAVEWAKRCPEPMPGEKTTLEIRPIFEMEDFKEAITPELREKEQKLRTRLEDVSKKPKVRTCFWFNDNCEQAAEFYVSLLPDSFIKNISRPEPSAPALLVELILAGTPYTFINVGPQHKLFPPASITVSTADQKETDRLWSALLADSGEESMFGWLTDCYGVLWQIVPDALVRMLESEDREAAKRASQSLLQMKKIDIATLEAAYNGE